MKQIIFVILCIMLIVTGCKKETTALLTDTILETNYLSNFKLEEFPNQTPMKIKISGGYFHSALVPYKMTTTTVGTALIVCVHLKLADGRVGNLEYELSVPDTVTEIKFGTKETVIWKRSKAGGTVGVTTIDQMGRPIGFSKLTTSG